MRRLGLMLALLGPLVAPLPAAAQAPDALCRGMRQVVEAAAESFDSLMPQAHFLPGSLEERRGVARDPGEPPRAVLYALMLRAPAAQRPSPAEARWRALHGEIGRCFPDATFSGDMAGQEGARAVWTLPRALIRLRRDDGMGGLSTAEVEIAILSRW